MVPDILNEVHWLIENKGISFLLTGSSPRKLRKKHANLLGGRAWRFTMAPLCYPEIKNFDIEETGSQLINQQSFSQTVNL
jgi:predicted AAA+ superfamily ATPase